MDLEHADAAAIIQPETARELFARATPKGRRLLELFARRQLVEFDALCSEFATSQNGLNALLGRLTRQFQTVQEAQGFYIYIPRMRAWAIGHVSAVNLRRALRAEESSRQAEIEFAG